MMEAIRQYLLDPRKDYPEPFYLLEYNGVPFSTLGGLQAISGQKKNGKSFVLTMLMSAVLRRESDRVMRYLAGLRVPERTIAHLDHVRRPELTEEERKKNPYKPSVLYVDTEMEKLNSAKVLRRVHWLCGWDMNQPEDNFHVLWMREVQPDEATKEQAYQKRYRLIKYAIEVLKPDAVFIDGVRDIIGDFNDNKESAELVQSLMSLASQKGICIWLALHMNPRPGNDDESKMRGHLGTELGNKVTDTLVSVKKKDPTGVTFTVRQQDARGKDMEDLKFEVTDDAGSLGIPKLLNQGAPVTTEEQRQRQEADEYFKLYTWTNIGATYTDLERFLRSKGITSNRKISQLFDTAMEAGIIYKNDKKKYYYKGLGGEVPDDHVERIPFDAPDGSPVPF
jgi:hypothetical protein